MRRPSLNFTRASAGLARGVVQLLRRVRRRAVSSERAENVSAAAARSLSGVVSPRSSRSSSATLRDLDSAPHLVCGRWRCAVASGACPCPGRAPVIFVIGEAGTRPAVDATRPVSTTLIPSRARCSRAVDSSRLSAVRFMLATCCACRAGCRLVMNEARSIAVREGLFEGPVEGRVISAIVEVG